MTVFLVPLWLVLGTVHSLSGNDAQLERDLVPPYGVSGQTQRYIGGCEPIAINAASRIARDVVPFVDFTFPAFACEERSLLFFAGSSGAPNTFSQNLIHEIASRTGVKPIIRVGGTSLDHSTYDQDQLHAVHFPPGQAEKNVPFGLKFGPSYFDSFANLPGVRYIFDIPLAKNNRDNALAFARAGLKSIGAQNIEQFEVGNEPNFYPGNDRRHPYGPKDFVKEWIEWTDAVSSHLELPTDQPMYQAVALASPRYPEMGEWTVQNLFNHGLEDVEDRIKSYSIHYYQTIASHDSNLQRDLMNHTAIVQGTKALADTVRYLNTKNPPIPLNIAEFGSALNPRINHYELESILGAALWQVDFMLWCMSLGVARTHIQLGIGFGFAPWQPVPYRGQAAKVNAPYYAHVFVADFLGGANGGDGGVPLQVLNLPLASDTLATYAGYVSGELDRVALVNLQEWSQLDSAQGPRPWEDVEMAVPGWCKYAEVWTLTSPLGATAADSRRITWAGQRWTWESAGRAERVEGIETVQIVQVRVGKISVRVWASEAVVIWLR